MSKLRSINTAIWSDPWFEDLTPNEKLLFIYLITNEKTNMLGVYEASVKKISNDTDIDREIVSEALKSFSNDGKVKYISNRVILINYMRHQNFNTNMKKSAIDIYNSLPKELKIKDLIISKDNPLEGFESLSNHYGMVPKVEVEVELELEVEVENKVEIEVKKEKREDLVYPFVSDKFINAWNGWKDYRKIELRKTFKSSNTEQTALNGLNTKSQNNEDVAIKIILQSIENTWTGLFELKNQNNNQSKKRGEGVDAEYMNELKTRLYGNK